MNDAQSRSRGGGDGDGEGADGIGEANGAALKSSVKNQGNSTANGRNGGDGFVDTSRADRAVWLMKCPPVVSRFFLRRSSSDSSTSSSTLSTPAPPESPRPVAKVVLSVDPLRSQDDDFSPQFTMELVDNESGIVPKCFAMDMSKDLIPMAAFSESSDGRISVEGRILNKFDMKVQNNEDIESYGKLCRERANKSMAKNRQIKIIGNDNGAHMRPMPGMASFGFREKKKVVPKGSDMKRTRKDRGEMERILFKLFESQQNWSLRQLIQETDQPEQFLKDLLRDLCVYNNKGANQGTYELKPEYKRSGDQSS